jgi:hypothetical protein
MPSTRRLRTLLCAIIAILAMTFAAAFSPAGAMSAHQCVGRHDPAHSHDNGKSGVPAPGCCAGMQCCPLVPMLPAVKRNDCAALPSPDLIVAATPLLLVRDIDPPPRNGST